MRFRAALLALVAVLVSASACSAPAAPAAPAAADVAAAAVIVAEPVSVRVPQIAARSQLVRTGMGPGGTPEVPPVTTPMQASWATWSPRPGQPGPAVLYGHVDGEVDGRRGVPGIFNRIRDLRPGNVVLVDRADGSAAVFEVARVASWPKSEFDDPESAVVREVYGDTAGPELRLVTCGGSFDQGARSYRDQVVVFARLVGDQR